MPTISLKSRMPIKVVSMKTGGLVKKTGTIAKLHKGERVLTVKQNKQYEKDKKIIRGVKSRKHTAGRASLSRAGDADYTTKRGDKDFHKKHKDVKSKRRPYQKRK